MSIEDLDKFAEKIGIESAPSSLPVMIEPDPEALDEWAKEVLDDSKPKKQKLRSLDLDKPADHMAAEAQALMSGLVRPPAKTKTEKNIIGTGRFKTTKDFDKLEVPDTPLEFKAGTEVPRREPRDPIRIRAEQLAEELMQMPTSQRERFMAQISQDESQDVRTEMGRAIDDLRRAGYEQPGFGVELLGRGGELMREMGDAAMQGAMYVAGVPGGTLDPQGLSTEQRRGAKEAAASSIIDEPWLQNLPKAIANMAPDMVLAGYTGARGGASAALAFWTTATYPDAYKELKEAGVDEEFARSGALVSSAVQAAIENIENPFAKLGKSVSKETLRKSAADIIKETFWRWFKEAPVEEGLQRATQESMLALGTRMSGAAPPEFWQQVGNVVETIKQAAGPMAVLGGGQAGLQLTAKAIADRQPLTARRLAELDDPSRRDFKRAGLTGPEFKSGEARREFVAELQNAITTHDATTVLERRQQEYDADQAAAKAGAAADAFEKAAGEELVGQITQRKQGDVGRLTPEQPAGQTASNPNAPPAEGQYPWDANVPEAGYHESMQELLTQVQALQTEEGKTPTKQQVVDALGGTREEAGDLIRRAFDREGKPIDLSRKPAAAVTPASQTKVEVATDGSKVEEKGQGQRRQELLTEPSPAEPPVVGPKPVEGNPPAGPAAGEVEAPPANRLQQIIQRKFGRHSDVAEISEDKLTPEQKKVRARAKKHGYDVSFIRGKRPLSINGVYDPQTPGKVYVNADADPYHAIISHEWAHLLEKENPALYKRWNTFLQTETPGLVKEAGETYQRLLERNMEKEEAARYLAGDVLEGESAASVMEDLSRRSLFWKAAVRKPGLFGWLANTYYRAAAKIRGVDTPEGHVENLIRLAKKEEGRRRRESKTAKTADTANTANTAKAQKSEPAPRFAFRRDNPEEFTPGPIRKPSKKSPLRNIAEYLYDQLDGKVPSTQKELSQIVDKKYGENHGIDIKKLNEELKQTKAEDAPRVRRLNPEAPLPIIPYGRIERGAGELFASNPSPSAKDISKLQGAPSPRDGVTIRSWAKEASEGSTASKRAAEKFDRSVKDLAEAGAKLGKTKDAVVAGKADYWHDKSSYTVVISNPWLDKNVGPVSYEKMLADAREAMSAKHINWYRDVGRGLAEIVGWKNLYEAAAVLGITSAQKSSEINVAETLTIMSGVRKYVKAGGKWEVDPLAEAIFKMKRPNGNGLGITEAQAREIATFYTTGDRVGAIKTTTFMNQVFTRGLDRFDPWSVQDVHQARYYGYEFRDIDRLTGGLVDATKIPSDSAWRLANFLTSKLAQDLGILFDHLQPAQWFWSKTRLSSKAGQKRRHLASFPNVDEGTWESSRIFVDKWKDEDGNEGGGELEDAEKTIDKNTSFLPKSGNYIFQEEAKEGFSNTKEVNRQLAKLSQDYTPRPVISTVPGKASGFTPPSNDNFRDRMLSHRGVMSKVLDKDGKLPILRNLGIPHKLIRGFGSYGEIEPNFVLVLQGPAINDPTFSHFMGSLVATYMGQDAYVLSYPRPVSANEESNAGVYVAKPDGSRWTSTEAQRLLGVINPKGDTGGYNFTLSSDKKRLELLYFGDDLDGWANGLAAAMAGSEFRAHPTRNFSTRSDYVERSRYRSNLQKSGYSASPARRSDLHKWGIDLLRATVDAYGKSGWQFDPETFIASSQFTDEEAGQVREAFGPRFSPATDDQGVLLQRGFARDRAGNAEHGKEFHAAISAASAAQKHGKAVEVKDLEAYTDPDAQLFLSPDGKRGAAVIGGNLVSVFRHPDSPEPIGPLLEEAAAAAIDLDCFDINGFLPTLYGKYGFSPTARLQFNREYAPAGWDFELAGEPDVVYMARDPNNVLGLRVPSKADGGYDAVRDRVPVFTDYDDVVKAHQDALKKLDDAGEARFSPADDEDGDDDVRFRAPRPEIEERLKKAHGAKSPTITQWIKDRTTRAINQATRAHEHIPNSKEFSYAREFFRLLKELPGSSQDEANRIVGEIVQHLDEKNIEVYERKLIAENLLTAVKMAQPLRFGFKDQAEVEEWLETVNAAVGRDRRVQDALEERKQIVRELVTQLVSHDILPPQALDNVETYYHQQVLSMMEEHQIATGGTNPQRVKRSFQRSRVSGVDSLPEQFDYNTSYIEAETKWMTDAIIELRKEKMIRGLKKRYDILPRLKRMASRENYKNYVGGPANLARVNEIRNELKTLWEDADRNTPESKARRSDLRKELKKIDPTAPLREQMAKAGQTIREMLENAEIDLGRFDAEHKHLMQDWESQYDPWQIDYYMEGTAWFKLLPWLAQGNGPFEAGKAAREILSAINERKKMIEEALGARFITPERLLGETHAIWQPEKGNLFYKTTTIPERVAEALQSKELESIKLTADQLGTVIAMAGPRRQLALPIEIVNQLELEKDAEQEKFIGAALTQTQKLWKVHTLFNPKRIVGYLLRNMAGDIDAAIGGSPAIRKRVPEAISMLQEYYKGDQRLSVELKAARDLGVIGASMTAQELPDLRDLKIFRRFHEAENPWASLPAAAIKAYYDTAKRINEFRESTLRLAAFLQYRDEIKSGTLSRYGGARKATVDALIDEMGADVAAAHLSRNLLGDYGNLTVIGNWLRRKLIPFWSWMEVNGKRYPRFAINAIEYGKIKGDKSAWARSVYTGFALAGVAGLYAMLATYNKLVHPEAEDELSDDERSSPHIILGREPDGSVILLRNTSALGEFLEWFGINTAIAMLPQYSAGQLTAKDLLKEVVKSPVNKVVGGTRPDLQFLFGVVPGLSYYPDVFNPRSVERGELMADVVGMKDEYRAAKGRIARDGSRAREHYLERLIGVSNPKANAMFLMYDLRDRFLQSKGKTTQERGASVSPIKVMREAAIAKDFEAFKEARNKYISDGHSYEGYQRSLQNIDPIGSRLNDELEQEFETKFLSGDQKKKLRMARDYASELQVRMWNYWRTAAGEDTPEQKTAAGEEARSKEIVNKIEALSRPRPMAISREAKAKGETLTSARAEWEQANEKTLQWLKDRGVTADELKKASKAVKKTKDPRSRARHSIALKRQLEKLSQ
jgi:hypothetical protein